jgi:Plasmid maintenance system antidote protein
MRKIPYPRPGEILQHEFLEPMGITAYRLAKDIGVAKFGLAKSLLVKEQSP